jgi:hypothetical protein
MPNYFPLQESIDRDGTSQEARTQPALDPTHILVDERSLQDLLTFARAYAKQLCYFAVEKDQATAQGDWRGFLPDDLDLAEIVTFMEKPEDFSLPHTQAYRRPHFALFLTFLRLLRHAQDELNKFTGRHLDFYYQQVLRMTKRPAQPDKVNVLVDLAPTTTEALLPAGTLLAAGVDATGQARFYRTDQELVVNRAQQARLSSVYVKKQITDLREERGRATGWTAIIQMLPVALGDPLPKYGETQQDVTADLLDKLNALVRFVATDLFMSFRAFRSLMQLKRSDDRTPSTLQSINQLLAEAGQKRDPNFKLTPVQESDLDANLEIALGSPHYPQVDAAHEIKTVDSFYENYLQVEDYFFMSAENFVALMEVATNQSPTDADWERAYTILEGAHKQKVYTARRQKLQAVRTSNGFIAMLAFAAGDRPAASLLAPLERLVATNPNELDEQLLVHINTIINSASAEQSKKEDELSLEQWERVYVLVELAQRTLENLAEPVAQKVEWRNLYAAPDATSVRVSSAVAADEKTPHWQTFGQAPDYTQDARLPSPQPLLGWAISSPLLALSQGTRTITLTFQSDQSAQFQATFVKLFSASLITASQTEGAFQFTHEKNYVEAEETVAANPLCIEISTAKNWIKPDAVTVRIGTYTYTSPTTTPEQPMKMLVFQWVLTIGANLPPIAPLSSADALPQSAWPSLRLMLQPLWQAEQQDYLISYQTLQALVLLHTHLQVDVADLTALQIQNDESRLVPNKPFEPFGFHPVAGARFYLGHPELVYKHLHKLTFEIEWMGAPLDLASHYCNYGITLDVNEAAKVTEDPAKEAEKKFFNMQISLVDEQRPLPVAPNASLFSVNKKADGTEDKFFDTTKPQRIPITSFPANVTQEKQKYGYRGALALSFDEELLTWARYWQWELNAPDFQHDAYPAVVAAKSVDLAAAIANRTAGAPINAREYKVNPPYTPKIKQLRLGYSAALEMSSTDPPMDDAPSRLFHIHPFGYQELSIGKGSEAPHFLPDYPNEGELYIGLQAVSPPQTLTLLWQVAEGSAVPDLTPAPVQWRYLSGNRWLDLAENKLRQDTTHGLINSGILLFDLPATQPNTLLPADLYWLRAAVVQNSDSVCDSVAIHTQAVSATLVETPNSAVQGSQPLPAGAIIELETPLATVAGLRQPYTSFGGKAAEEESTFYTRVSERLRHKQRALTQWDYERLVLDRFPQIYKAKCLPAAPQQPGQVTVIVIPDIRNKSPFNPFEPKAPANLLAEIQAYLADYIPPVATVTVKNARYVPVKVRLAVRFRASGNPGYFKQRLNEDLNRFLSPWAYTEGAEIVIGSRIYANVIINFLEERPYVDYVALFKLFKSEDGGNNFDLAPVTSDGHWVAPAQPDGVLVAARNHEIDLITDVNFSEENFKGINYMIIELDFIVG